VIGATPYTCTSVQNTAGRLLQGVGQDITPRPYCNNYAYFASAFVPPSNN